MGSERRSNESLSEWSERLRAEAAAERAAKQKTIDDFRAKVRAEKDASDKARAERQQQRADALQQQRTAEFDKVYKAGYQRAFVAAGGEGAAFDTLWEQSLRDEARLEISKAQAQQQRAAMARMTRSGF